MSLDLYSKETSERLSEFRPVEDAEPGAFDKTGDLAMQTFAKAGRALSMAGAVGPKVESALFGIQPEAREKLTDVYFDTHEKVFQNAVDSWTPNPNDVGKAAQVVGPLLAQIPMVIASPALTVAETQLSASEDLVRQGVDTTKANLVGAVQGTGMGLGIWMPILGKNLWQRVIVGGAGFNAVQGVATRAASGAILEGTPAEGEFKAFDGSALTLDVMLGLAFGGLAHLSPAQREQGGDAWNRIAEWAQKLKPSEIDALVTLRQAQHLNVDTMPGTPVGINDIEAHTTRVRTAVNQLINDRPVEISNLPAARVEPDGRFQEAATRGEFLLKEADRVRAEEGIPDPKLSPAPPRGAETGVIPRAENLSDAERAIETKFADHISKNLDDVIRRYKEKFGNVINTDNARELSKDYAASKESRSRLSAAVHEPSSWLAKEIYRRELATPAPDGKRNLVVFTSGGTGAGKSSAIDAIGGAKDAQIVFDTNMNGLESSVNKIDQALAAGKTVSILHVHRDPVEAMVHGALPRAMRMGRSVPLDAHVDTHVGSAQTIQALAIRYKNNPKVNIDIIDNTGGKNGARLGDLETINKTDYNDIKSRLSDSLDEEYKSGRISKAVYEGTVGSSPQGIRPEASRGSRRESESQSHGRGSRTEGGQEDSVSPLTLAAEQLAAEQPHLEITVGKNSDGSPITKTIRQFLDDAKAETARANDDARLYKIAAACMLGVA